MKTFKELFVIESKEKDDLDVVQTMKKNKDVMIKTDNNKMFSVWVKDEMVDEFKDKKSAIKAAEELIKLL